MTIKLMVGDRVLYRYYGRTISGRVAELGDDYVKVTDESLTMEFPVLPFVPYHPPIELYNWVSRKDIIERLGKKP